MLLLGVLLSFFIISTSAIPAPQNSTRSVALNNTIDPTDQQVYTDGHNIVRQQVNAHPLVWDATVASAAQAWADQCQIPGGPPPNGYGSNGVLGLGNYPASSAVITWAASGALAESDPRHGEYLTMVSNITTHFGCGWSHCVRNSISGPGEILQLHVCYYNPPATPHGILAN